MYATFRQPTLARTLADLNRAIDRRGTLPVLQNARIAISGDLASFYATDLERSVSIDLIADGAVDASGAGRTTFPVREALAFAKSTAKDSGVRISIGDDGVTLSNGAGASTILPAIDTDEMPVIAPIGDRIAEVDGPGFLAALKRTLVCAATDETRPILTGVHVKIVGSSSSTDGGVIELAAADNYRIAVQGIEAEWLADDIDPFTVIGAGLKSALAVLKGADVIAIHRTDAVSRYIDLIAASWAKGYGGGNVRVSCRLIDGQYPNYQSILPVSTDYSTTFETAAFAAAVKSIRPAAKEVANVVRLVANGRIEITAGTATASVLAATSGLDQDDPNAAALIAFNVKYLADALATLGDRGRMSMNDPLQPAVFTSDAIEHYRTVLMPVRVKS